MEGIIGVFKPKGISSYKVIDLIKKKTGIKRIGHGGSLDPFAEGVLVVGIGKENTKKLDSFLKKSQKEYIVEIYLNKKSDTFDITGNITDVNITKPPTKKKIKETLKTFIGEIEQKPPIFSAIKINGNRLCDLARSKRYSIEELSKFVKSRKVFIDKIDLVEYKFPKLILKIICRSGVYIRSIANDLGEKLNTGGVVASLLRTKVNDISINSCKTLQEILSNP